MNSFKKYRMKYWESAIIWAIRFLEDADFKGSWRLSQYLSSAYPSRDIVTSTKYGFQLIVNPQADSYQRTIFECGWYEPGTLAFMSRVLRQGDIFMDIGANIGLMSLAAARFVGAAGAVYAFEPEAKIFERLLENIELNKAYNVTAVQAAMGAVSGVRQVFTYPSVNIGRASLVKSEGALASGKAKMTTITSFVVDKGLDCIRMIKVDVEGFEYEVLTGARDILVTDNPPILCVECDNEMPREQSGGSMVEINNLVLGTGQYELYGFEHSKFASDGRIKPITNVREVKRYDNIIYIPIRLINEIESDVFTA